MIKPFLSNKGHIENSDVILAENGHMITDPNKVVNVCNNYYINIVEITSGKAPPDMGKTMPPGALPTDTIDRILIEYANHPSIQAIAKMKVDNKTFTFKEVEVDQIYKLLQTIDHTKSTGEDGISPKYIKASADLLAEPFTKIINMSLKECFFQSRAKVESVLPLFKSLERILKKNYRPVSVLSTFSKIMERVIK